jgi:Uma2 family endonuclease
MSYEEYLNDPTIDEHTEWVDGEVIPMMSISDAHQEVAGFLIELLRTVAGTRKLGKVYYDPFQMKLGRGRAPDVLLVRHEHAERVHRLFLDGPADLVIEVISEGTEGIDRGEKFFEYERGGVPEYWIIDPDREVAEFYLLDEKGVYRSANVPVDGTFASPALDGFVLKVQWLWDRPTAVEALRESGFL